MDRMKALLTLWLRPTACLLLVLISTSVSGAPINDDAAWLEWSPPPECPPKSHIVQRVNEWLDGVPRRNDVKVETNLSWHEGRWNVVVDVAFDGHIGTRAVAVADCSEAADFVAIAVVLAIDPARTDVFQIPGDGSAGGTVDVEPSSEPSARTTLERGHAEPAEGLLRREVATEAQGRPRKKIAEGRPAGGLRPHLTFLGLGSWGALPGPRPGVAAAIGVDLGHWSISLGADWFPAMKTSVPEANTSLDFSLLSGRLTAAYLLLGPRFNIGPAVSFQAGAFRVKQE